MNLDLWRDLFFFLVRNAKSTEIGSINALIMILFEFDSPLTKKANISVQRYIIIPKIKPPKSHFSPFIRVRRIEHKATEEYKAQSEATSIFDVGLVVLKKMIEHTNELTIATKMKIIRKTAHRISNVKNGMPWALSW